MTMDRAEGGQPVDPDIELVETDTGETTLLIDGGQAMQAWEQDLMWRSSDLLCEYGSEFLEVGLGLGISAIRIASNPATRHHIVVEKYRRVIELFHERNPIRPPALQVVEADIVDYIHTLAPGRLDGIFFDPYFPPAMRDDEQLWKELVPAMRRALRLGGVLLPFATTRPVLRWQFTPYFARVIVEKCRFTAYRRTNYMRFNEGEAYIQCFVKTEA
ncbi:MAG: class I SAM-dependent methyltransferase [Actinobacteria bacterium]|nr:class I SAM-dependent methyltransferase [Actinomycetota bacterium]